jgi:hypothetical protein
MNIYIFTLLFLSTLSFITVKINNNLFTILVSLFIYIFLSLLYGLRQDVGIDFINYQNIYYDDINYYGNTDLIFDLLVLVFRYFNQSFTTFNIFLGFLQYFLFFLISKNLKLNFFLSLFYFLLFGGMFISFNLVRQSISTLIAFNGLFFLSNKKFIKAIFFFITSTLFHFSSIFIVFFSFFIKFINTKFKWYFLFLLGITLFILEPFDTILPLLPEFLKDIVESSINIRLNTGFGVLFYLFMSFYFYTFLQNKFFKNDKFLYYLLALYILGYSLFLFSTQYLVYNRITIFFQLCLPFIFAKLSVFKSNYPLKKLINVTLVFTFLLIFIRELINISTFDSNNLFYNFNSFITFI